MWWPDNLTDRCGAIEQDTLKPFFWLWLPLLWMIGQLCAEFYFPIDALISFHAENGLHEWLQVFMLLGGCGFACHALLTMDRAKHTWLALWLAMAAIGCFWVAGEEISWGQWLFFWDTPPDWALMNGQHETNLHNNSRWLNQIPDSILKIGIVVGGLFLPLMMTLKPQWVPHRFASIYPPKKLWVIALLLVFAVVAHKTGKLVWHTKLFARGSEVEELYIYYFVLLYIFSLWQRRIPS